MESFLLCCACAFVCVTVVHTQFSASASIGATFYWLDVFFVSYLKAPVYLRFLGLALLEVYSLCVRLVRFSCTCFTPLKEALMSNINLTQLSTNLQLTPGLYVKFHFYLCTFIFSIGV